MTWAGSQRSLLRATETIPLKLGSIPSASTTGHHHSKSGEEDKERERESERERERATHAPSQRRGGEKGVRERGRKRKRKIKRARERGGGIEIERGERGARREGESAGPRRAHREFAGLGARRRPRWGGGVQVPAGGGSHPARGGAPVRSASCPSRGKVPAADPTQRASATVHPRVFASTPSRQGNGIKKCRARPHACCRRALPATRRRMPTTACCDECVSLALIYIYVCMYVCVHICFHVIHARVRRAKLRRAGTEPYRQLSRTFA